MRRTIQLCVCVAVLFCMTAITSCSNQHQEADNNVTNDYPPMVRFDGTLYSATSGQDIDIFSLKLDEVGMVSSCTTNDPPMKNNQANDDLVGCKIYSAKDLPDYIFVLYDGDYCPYIKRSN